MNKMLVMMALIAIHAWTDADQVFALTLRDCLARASAANTQLRTSSYDEKIAAKLYGRRRAAICPGSIYRRATWPSWNHRRSNSALSPSPPSRPTTALPTSPSIKPSTILAAQPPGVSRQSSINEAVQMSYRGQEQDIFLQVVRAYFGILAGQRFLATAEDEVRQMTSHQKVAQNLYDQGVVTRNDLLQAEVKLANSRQKRLSAANGVENSWLYLNFLTGREAGFRSDLEEPEQQTETAELAMMMEIALGKRPELAAMKKTIQADDAAIRETRSNYYPELFARLAMDYVQNDRVQEQAIMSATVGFKINLFDGLATTSRLRQAVQIKAREEERLRNLEANIRLELELALNDMKVAGENLVVSELAIRQGQENLRINSDRYAEKVGTATEVVDAQTLLTQTRNDHFRSIFDYQVAAARVKRALGEL